MKSPFLILTSLLFCFPLLGQGTVVERGTMPNEVLETSGLIFHNGKLITHNDSGNTPQLFEIDTVSMQITRTITISNVENIDWEDLDQDENFIYIGDFGNNNGTRKDLIVYRISKQDFDLTDTVSAEMISFSYEDQTDFSDSGNSDWDAEAMFVLEDQLMILTKQWKSNGTVAYTIPKTPGTYSAKRLDSYPNLGLVTGATYNTLSEVLFLIGYSQILGPFVTRIEGVTKSEVFKGKIEKTNLSIGLAQVEGITYTSIDSYLFSSEFFTRDNPSITSTSRLFSFKTLDKEQPIEPEIPENPEIKKEQLILFRAIGSEFLQYELTTQKPILGSAIFDMTGRRIRSNNTININENSIDLSTLKSSIYYLTFYLGDEIISKPFSRN